MRAHVPVCVPACVRARAQAFGRLDGRHVAGGGRVGGWGSADGREQAGGRVYWLRWVWARRSDHMQIHHASPTCWSLHGPCPVPEEKPIGICVTHTCQSAASVSEDEAQPVREARELSQSTQAPSNRAAQRRCQWYSLPDGPQHHIREKCTPHPRLIPRLLSRSSLSAYLSHRCKLLRSNRCTRSSRTKHVQLLRFGRCQ